MSWGETRSVDTQAGQLPCAVYRDADDVVRRVSVRSAEHAAPGAVIRAARETLVAEGVDLDRLVADLGTWEVGDAEGDLVEQVLFVGWERTPAS